MLKLFHHPISTVSRYVRLLLCEYGIVTALIEENEWQKRAEFLAINLAGTVPVLVTDDGYAVCGAAVISEYLNETYNAFFEKNHIFPQSPYKRAEMRRLCEWFLGKFEAEVIRPLVREKIYKRDIPITKGGGSPNTAILHIARGNICPHINYLSWLVKTRDWIGDSSLSCADFAAAAGISILDYMGEIDWDLYPIAKDWYSRIKSRPSFRPILNERVRGIPPAANYANLDF